MEDQSLIKVKSRIGTLHTEEVYRKFKEAGASPMVLKILAEGVPLYFLNLAIRKYPRGRDCNNQSALAQQEFVSETLREWEQKDYVRRIPLSEARVILPVSVANRWSHTKRKLKYRLVLDCSPLTKNLSYGKIKLPDLNYLRHQIMKGDMLSLIDITSFYLHFTLDPTYSDRLCFQWDFLDGKGLICFRAIVMLFGVPHAPWITTMCTDVIVAWFRKLHSIILNPFIDDFSHVCHGSLEQAQEEFVFAQEELSTWGFIVSKEKLVPPATKNMVLGYEVDTEMMTIRFDENKWHELRFLVEDAIQPFIQARHLARIVGKFVSMGYGCKVPVTCFLPRAIAAIAVVTEENDWRSWNNLVNIDQQMYSELLFLLHNIKKWNGTNLKKPYKIHFYTSDLPVAETTFQPFVGDASLEAAAIYSIRNPRKFSIKYFSATMSQTSSARRELASIELLIMNNSAMFEENSTVVYASDNISINKWINVGSCRTDVAPVLQRIFLECLRLGVDLRVTWIPRSHYLLMEADMISRRDTDEYTLRNRDWRYLVGQYGQPFTLDVFASKFLHRTPIFFSKFPSPASSGTDGLHQPWTGHEVWLFPPRRLLAATIYRVQVEKNLSGAIATLDNAEGLMRLLMFKGNHAPVYVYQVYKFPIKIRMGYFDSKQDAVKNQFSNTWHDLVVIFFDKNRTQSFLPARCFLPRGECQTCGGNDFVTFNKIMY